MAKDPELLAHLEWLGYIQPVGLVVSPPALAQAQAHINRNVIPQHQRFLACLPVDDNEQLIPRINDFPAFVRSVLDWQETDLIPFEQAAEQGIDVTGLEVVLPEYNETLRPTWIVPEFQSTNAAAAPGTDLFPAPMPSTGKKSSSLFDNSGDDDESDDDEEEQDDATGDDFISGSSTAPAEPTNADRFVMLITQVPVDQDLDEPLEESDRRWHASPHARFERLLRESQVPAGLLTNGRNLRLVYAPRGETSGYLTFNVEEMTAVAGRPIFAALHMLLNSDRLFNLEKRQRLPAILVESRKYQNTVSTQLAQQVMAALYELLRGFQAADDQWNGRLLKDVLATNPQHVYHGLLTVLMRTVFILYAEDRNMLSNHPVYTNYYSIIGLFERLRSDAGQYPDTMDQRYGAWAQLLTLFRMIYEGGSHDDLRIPPRKGYLFDPERYPFLEGFGGQGSGVGESPEPTAASPKPDTRNPIPRLSDGVVFRVLNNLLMLDGERLSYRSLDVEQIGSVYEAIMGFEVEVSTGRSIAIKPVKKHGAPATINLEDLLKQKAADRAKWLKERTDQDFKGQSADALKSAKSIDDLLAALAKKIANDVTPNVVPTGAVIFQPSDERRRSGSHYTPRSLTEPIVRTTLQPILQQLVTPFSPVSGEKVADRPDEGDVVAEPQVWQPTAADKRRFTAGEIAERIRLSKIAVEHAKQARQVGVPHPSQILDLKICDPAMGSGAFLVETCRQLGDELIKAWYAHDAVPTDIPPDEDEVLYARRLVAQRCLYGVDKNDMAVDLAKLSLWLVTLAKDHPFTFLDHALRHGDSLVGLTRRQIIGFHWEPKKQKQFGEDLIQKRLDRATEARAKILNAREDVPYRDQEQRLAVADEALNVVRLTGDACVSAFFAGSKKNEREQRCEELGGHVEEWYRSGFDINKRVPIAQAAAHLRGTLPDPRNPTPETRLQHPIPAFHWEIEFPEVFARENGGFDAFVGNPPFISGADIWPTLGGAFRDYIRVLHPNSSGKAVDLVAHFFRRCFSKLRQGGTLGLIATNTICQGDTREAGLREICLNGGSIYSAKRRMAWPGVAAVVVSVVHLGKQLGTGIRCVLDGKEVRGINSFLLASPVEVSVEKLKANLGRSYRGHVVLGMGFTFDDEAKTGAHSPIAKMEELVAKDPKNKERIYPYIGGAEINRSPTQSHHRYAICFGNENEEQAEEWPDLLQVVRERVLPEREKIGGYSVAETRREKWWQFGTYASALQDMLESLNKCLALSRVSPNHAVAFQPTDRIFADSLVVFSMESYAAFCVLQSQSHEFWARFLGSSMKDDLRYTSSDCFDTFPFPSDFESDEGLEDAGRTYDTYRAKILVNEDIGLTTLYNRFHDPHEQSEGILELRRLHGLMDGAVLRAYGWDDLAESARCEFLLDYEEEEDDADAGPPVAGNPTRKRGTKKKPWRLRWPDDFRDEVLARLLELNERRHKEELLAGKAVITKRTADDDDSDDDDDEDHETESKTRKTKKTRKPKNTPATGQQEMEF